MRKFFKTFLIPLFVALFVANGFVYADSIYPPPTSTAGYIVIGANDYSLESSSAIFVSPSNTIGIGTTSPYGVLNIASNEPVLTLTDLNGSADRKHVALEASNGHLFFEQISDDYNDVETPFEIDYGGNVSVNMGDFSVLSLGASGDSYLGSDSSGKLKILATPLLNHPTGTTTITNLLVTGTADISNLIMGPIAFPSDSTTTIPILESTNLWVNATTTINNSNPNATSTIRGPLELKSADQSHGCYFSYGATTSLICY